MSMFIVHKLVVSVWALNSSTRKRALEDKENDPPPKQPRLVNEDVVDEQDDQEQPTEDSDFQRHLQKLNNELSRQPPR